MNLRRFIVTSATFTRLIALIRRIFRSFVKLLSLIIRGKKARKISQDGNKREYRVVLEYVFTIRQKAAFIYVQLRSLIFRRRLAAAKQ